MSAAKLPSCLWGAGVLGHTWVATRIGCEPPHAYESLAILCSYGADAVRALDELKPEKRGHIFERVGRKKWVRRSRAYALLNQGPHPYEPAIAEGA